MPEAEWLDLTSADEVADGEMHPVTVRGMYLGVARVGDGTANPYLAYAAALAAGLDGIRRELEPPEPIVGMIYDLPEERQGRVLPASFPEALQALDDDEVIRGAVGEELIETFKSIKAVELERFRAWVTDWEFREYVHHL